MENVIDDDIYDIVLDKILKQYFIISSTVSKLKVKLNTVIPPLQKDIVYLQNEIIKYKKKHKNECDDEYLLKIKSQLKILHEKDGYLIRISYLYNDIIDKLFNTKALICKLDKILLTLEINSKKYILQLNKYNNKILKEFDYINDIMLKIIELNIEVSNTENKLAAWLILCT